MCPWLRGFRDIRELPQWVNVWLLLALWAFFGNNRHICMVAICDTGKVSWSQIFPWNRSWLNKNMFRENERGQFLHTNNIYCVLLAINSSKQRNDNQCLARCRWCLLSVYHDIVTCPQRKLKTNYYFFKLSSPLPPSPTISLVDNHISPYF